MSRLRATVKALLVVFSCFYLSACISDQKVSSEQQARMQRCDQYIDKARDDCLSGMPVTIKDYKTDYKEFERTEKERIDKENAAQEKAIKEKIKKESDT